MKKILFSIALLITGLLQHSFAQDTTQQASLSGLLAQYYGIKDALVAGSATAASAKAGEFIKTLNTVDSKVISEGNAGALLKDAASLSTAKDIKKQRAHFATLSSNMAAVAKSVKLTAQPVYQLYCPMKKAYWLSSEKVIKNPYYGSLMLSCGEVTGTINP